MGITFHFVSHVSSGFYYIAKEANVPIILSFPNYKKKEYVFTEAFDVSGKSLEETMEWCQEQVKAFQAHKGGLHNENVTPFESKPPHLKRVIDPQTKQYAFVPKDGNA